MGFYEQQIDPVQLSVLEHFLACSLYSEKTEFVAATVTISIRSKNYQCNFPHEIKNARYFQLIGLKEKDSISQLFCSNIWIYNLDFRCP